MATLLDLPAELLVMVVEALEQDLLRQDDNGDIYKPGVRLYKAVCLACKQLNLVATPYLYQELELGIGKDYTSVRPLLRTLSAQPELTKLVKILELVPSHHLSGPPPTAEELASFTAALTPLKGKQLYEDIVGALKLGCHNAELLVVLCMTTHINRLDFALDRRDSNVQDDEGKCAGCPHFLECVQDILSLRSAAYSSLEDVAVQGKSQREFGLATQHAVRDAFLRLPSISCLHFSGLPRIESAPVLRSPEPSSTIKDLSVCGGFLRTRALNNIISSCKALEKVDMRYATLYTESDGADGPVFDLNVQAPTIFAALLQHRGTLRSLEFTDLNYDGLDFEQISALGSLSVFCKLERLEVEESRSAAESDYFYGIDHFAGILPPSLQDLTLHTHRNIEDLHILLAMIYPCKLEHLQDLEIIFRVGPGHNEDHAAAWRQLPGGLIQKNSAGSLGWRDIDSSGRLVFQCKWQLLRPKLASIGSKAKGLALYEILELHDACQWFGTAQRARSNGTGESQAMGS